MVQFTYNLLSARKLQICHSTPLFTCRTSTYASQLQWKLKGTMTATLTSPSFPSTCLFSSNERIKLYSYILVSQSSQSHLRCFRVKALKEETEEIKTPSSPEEIAQKYGLEAGLWKIFNTKEDGEEGVDEKKKSKGDQAKELLAKYGGAYLATSITLSLISFTLCYALVSAGIDVQSLLQKVKVKLA